jgi:hypothetical protein
MVSHIQVEEAINHMLGNHTCIVTAIPDSQRGEQLVVFYACPEIVGDALWEQLRRSGLPKLWLAKRDHFLY